MLTPVQRVVLGAVVALVGLSAALAVASLLPRAWIDAPPEPRPPLPLQVIEGDALNPGAPTRGMTLGEGGFGTILAAPARSPGSPPEPMPVQAGKPDAAQALPVRLLGRVRLLARLDPPPQPDRLVVVNLDIPPPHFGTIILREGCLRLAAPGEPHAILPARARLYVDREGYLTAGIFADGSPADPRIGEPAWWEGRHSPPGVDQAALASIRALCGPGDAVVIGPARSVAVSQAEADDRAARTLMDRYGLPRQEALRSVRACRARLARGSGIDPAKMIDNPCGSTPPSPVADPRACPPGTAYGGGLCRTPEGHVRPVPDHLKG